MPNVLSLAPIHMSEPIEPIDHDASNLEELLAQLDRAVDTDHRKITVAEILIAVGARSFAPTLILVGALITSPLSGIPGFPTAGAILVFLVSIQMMLGRDHFWLPSWLLQRTVPRKSVKTAIQWLQRPARVIDHFIRPRLTALVRGPAETIIALLSLMIASSMPFLELIPFSSSLAGIILLAFGLALVSFDGLLALIAYAATGAALWLTLFGLFL